MNEIVKICDEIKNNKKCDGCSSKKFINCECASCGTVNTSLKELIDKLIIALNNTQDFDYETLINLYMIKDLNIKEVTSVIDRYDLDNVIKNKINNVIDNKFKASINKEDAEMFIKLLDSNVLSRKVSDFISMILTRLMIMDKIDTSNANKKIILKYFTEVFMRDKVNNPKCYYVDSINGQGDSFYNIIRYKESVVDKLLDDKRYVELLRLVFHECTHTFQNYYMHKGTLINELLVLQTKEEVINNHYPNYYDENYYLFSAEVEARYSEYYSLLEILKVFELGISEQATSIALKEMDKENNNMRDKSRVLNGIQTTVDELFSSIKLTPQHLYEYPLLNLEFKIENGVVVKKSQEEMLGDCNNYMSNVQDNNIKEQIDNFYKSVLLLGYHK